MRKYIEAKNFYKTMLPIPSYLFAIGKFQAKKRERESWTYELDGEEGRAEKIIRLASHWSSQNLIRLLILCFLSLFLFYFLIFFPSRSFFSYLLIASYALLNVVPFKSLTWRVRNPYFPAWFSCSTEQSSIISSLGWAQFVYTEADEIVYCFFLNRLLEDENKQTMCIFTLSS